MFLNKANTMRKVVVSVIVPVYNKKKTLQACIDSLSEQTIEKGLMEVIFVDDGSTDESLALCRQAADNFFFMRVVHQENKGVSEARNAGMRLACGEYLMFLDADDFLSCSTVKNVVTFFDTVKEEVDVVTYPLIYLNRQTGKTRSHKREKWLVEEGVYDLTSNPFIVQTTMNVCVRNRQQANIQFSSAIKMGEDQLFILKNLKEKAKIGFCSRAEYVYVKDGENCSRVGNNPLYAYDDMLHLYNELIKVGIDNPQMKRYGYQVILYNIAWRLTSDLLFPTFCAGKERVLQDKRLSSVMRKIPDYEYLDSPYLDEFHKGFLLKKYGFIGDMPPIKYCDENTKVLLQSGKYWETDKPTVVISYCMYKNSALHVRGRLICPSFILDESPLLYLESEDLSLSLTLSSSSFDYHQAKVKTAKCYSFETILPVNRKRKLRVWSFFIRMTRCEIQSLDIEINPLRHNALIHKQEMKYCDHIVRVHKNSLVLERLNFMRSAAMQIKACLDNRSLVAKRAAIWLFLLQKNKKRVWLYVDLPSSPRNGNALIQLLHDLKKNDGVSRYYISNYEDKLVCKHPNLAGCILKCESREHVYYSMKAEVVLASYLENYTFRPVSQRTFNGLGDLIQPQTYIYLQHGILHAHMPWYFSFDRILFDFEVVSTRFEVQNLTERYYFPKKALIKCGMPRFDDLMQKKTMSKRIIFAPSWRAYLVRGDASERIGLDVSFMHSSFYQEIKLFLDMLAKSKILEDYGYTLEVQLHPNFKCYEDLFKINSDVIMLAQDDIEENSYSVMISDFSSYVYDFVYTGCRILYFIPDYTEFIAGLSQYSKLDLSFEEGFGPFCTSAQEAVMLLESILESQGMKQEGCDLYADRRQGFFLHCDGRNAARLYEAVAQDKEEII